MLSIIYSNPIIVFSKERAGTPEGTGLTHTHRHQSVARQALTGEFPGTRWYMKRSRTNRGRSPLETFVSTLGTDPDLVRSHKRYTIRPRPIDDLTDMLYKPLASAHACHGGT